MKILDGPNSDSKVAFESLESGTVFRYGKYIYLKLHRAIRGNYQAVELESNIVTIFTPTTKIDEIYPDAVLNLRGN